MINKNNIITMLIIHFPRDFDGAIVFSMRELVWIGL